MTIDTADIFGSDQIGIHVACVGQYVFHPAELTKPVKGATLIGEAQEIMSRISMCGNDLELAPGFCGSISGSVNVTVGQPHIKVDSITIGGR